MFIAIAVFAILWVIGVIGEQGAWKLFALIWFALFAGAWFFKQG